MELAPRLLVFSFLSASAIAQSVFSTDFEQGLPAAIQPGAAAIVGVQGFAGLGPAGRAFSGSFLRSPGGNTVTLSLVGLPAHDTLELDFLLAAIDSLDGAWLVPPGDWFAVKVDGAVVFREAFANAGATNVQTYAPPAGVQLARNVDLGFQGPGVPFLDSAYDLGADPLFRAIPHSATTATIEFVFEGLTGVLTDESWAIDGLDVRVSTSAEGTAAAFGASCGPRLTATSTPQVGGVVWFRMDSLPAGSLAAFGAFGLARGALGAYALPIPLDGYGLPGCWLLLDPSVMPSFPYMLAGTSATAFLVVPNDPGLLGVQFLQQGWVVSPSANPVGITTSNALAVRVGPRHTMLEEDFATDAGLDPNVSGGLWQNGAHSARLGGDGRHGSFDPALGGPTAAEYTWDTTAVTIPGSLTPSGLPFVVTDGRFQFTDFTLPAGITLNFVGPVPPQILVRGKVEVLGTIRLNGAAMTTFNGRGIVTTPAPYVNGQPGGVAGAGGGRGGNGGNECQGTGPIILNGVIVTNGQNGEDVRLPAGHAYAMSSVNTGGRGSGMNPPTGIAAPNTPAISTVYRAYFAPGGSGGGFTLAGGTSTVTPITNLQVGAVPPAGVAFPLFPFPPVSAPAGYTSLNHFLVGGSGGGGGGTHAFGTFTIGASDVYIAGAGGSGGGGALALRAGNDLTVAAGASLQAKGGAGVLIRGNDSNSTTNVYWGVTSPGGGGSGGSFLLQSARDLSVLGGIDTSGGDGSRTGQVFIAQINVTSHAGAGSPGFYRLEAAGNLTVGAATMVPAYTAAQNAGALTDRDDASGCRSTWRPSGLLAAQWQRYELDVDTDGDGVVDVTYTDSGAPGTLVANDPNGPVEIHFQGAQFAPGASSPTPGTFGPWRAGIGTAAVPGIALDGADGFRFELLFHTASHPNCVVKALRVHAN